MITKLSGDVEKAAKELKGLMDLQADEIRKHGETSTNTAAKVQKAEEKMIQLEKDMKGVTDQIEEFKKQQGRPNYGGGGEIKSIGTQFIESDAYKSFSGSSLKETAPVSFKSFFDMSRKDIDSTPAAGGLLAGTYRVPTIMAPPDEDLRMRDLLNTAPIGAPSLEYIEESGFVNTAATVAEKVAAPQSNITFEQKTAQVRTIAHWLPATLQILQDAPMLRNYIDNRLRYGLKMTEEAQILYGSGTGEDLLGLMVHTGTQNAGIRGTATMIDHIRHSFTLARIAGYPVTGVILNPIDWETIEISKGTDGHYIFTSVNIGGQMQLFRVPVVESTSMNQGEFLTGAFGLSCQLLDREQSTVRVSDSHSDYFIRRMTAILAEERVALPVYRPEALVKGSFATA
jgi:HK97 family phage major capsid protein